MNKLSSFLIILLALVLILITIAGNHGLLHLKRINQELEELERQNNRLESEIITLENRIFGIQQSKFTLEKKAREKLGLSKPGEIVYIFPETPQRKQDIENSE